MSTIASIILDKLGNPASLMEDASSHNRAEAVINKFWCYYLRQMGNYLEKQWSTQKKQIGCTADQVVPEHRSCIRECFSHGLVCISTCYSLSLAVTYAFTFCTMLVTTAVDLCVSQHYLSDLGSRFIHEHPSFTETFRVFEQDVELMFIHLADDDDVG